MPLTAASATYIQNALNTTPVLSKSCAFAIVHFCATNYHDPIRSLCAALHVSRSGYYKWCNRYQRPYKHMKVVKAIKSYQALSNNTVGYRKMAAYLRLNGITKLSNNSIYRIMKKANMFSCSIRTRKNFLLNRVTSAYQDLLKRNFSADQPNQKWCIDITQLNAADKRFYLCAIIDLYDRSIVAYRISSKQNKSLVEKTIHRAYMQLPADHKTPVLLHSDQGTVFRSDAQRRFLNTRNITPSMSKPGTPYDNAVIESFFSALKTEYVHRLPQLHARSLRTEVEQYIVFYNHYRIHMKLCNTPMTVRELALKPENRITFGGHNVHKKNSPVLEASRNKGVRYT